MTGRFCSKDFGIFTAMVATEFSSVGLNTLFKAATSEGMTSDVFLVYSYAIQALLLLPFALFSLRSRLNPPLSVSILGKIGLLGLLGCMYNNLGYRGVKLSSPTLSSAMSNLTPAFTFILAVVFGMEKMSMKKESSIAKVVGTVVCITGALVATLYHGPPVFVASQPSIHLSLPQPSIHLGQPQPSIHLSLPQPSDWVVGGGLLALEYAIIPVSYIVQAIIMSEYPSEFVAASFHAVSASIFCVLVSSFAEKNNPSGWIIRSKIGLTCIVTAGILNSGYYVIHLWTVRYKGPVFLAMFRPLSILIAVVMGAIFLGDSFYLGSLIGGILISIGFYTMMWGAAKEEMIDAETTGLDSLSEKKIHLLISSEGEQT